MESSSIFTILRAALLNHKMCTNKFMTIIYIPFISPFIRTFYKEAFVWKIVFKGFRDTLSITRQWGLVKISRDSPILTDSGSLGLTCMKTYRHYWGRWHTPRTKSQSYLMCIDLWYGISNVPCCSLGLAFSVGIYYTEWLDVFSAGPATTAWVGSINTAMLFMGGE